MLLKDGLLDDRLGLGGPELDSKMGLIGDAFSTEQKIIERPSSRKTPWLSGSSRAIHPDGLGSILIAS